LRKRDLSHTSRRDWLKHAAAGGGLGLAAVLAGCQPGAGPAGGSGGRKRLRAGMSSAGLQGTWNKLGYDSAMLWGDLLDVDIEWFDGEFDGQKQREKIDLAAGGDWDFFAVQAHQIGILEEPCRRMKKRGIPIIDMDTLLVERDRLREVGAWTFITPDHVKMAEQCTRYMIEKIGGRGPVIHIGGESAHSGAQDRKRGFENVVAEYPEVRVLGGGVRWSDWKTEVARDNFDTLLQQADGPVAGAFFHNDDMALACVPAIAGTEHEGMVITSVDGQETGLSGVKEGKLAATSVNPSGMIHGWAVMIGQFIVRNREKIDDLPLEIVLPSPLVSKEAGNLEAMFYLTDAKHCLL